MNTIMTKNKAAQLLGKAGGKARAKNLSPEEIREIARMGGLAKAVKHKQQTEPVQEQGPTESEDK